MDKTPGKRIERLERPDCVRYRSALARFFRRGWHPTLEEFDMKLRTHAVALSLLCAIAAPMYAQTAEPTSSSDSTQLGQIVIDSTRVFRDAVTDAAPAPIVSGASMTGLRAGVHLRETARPNRPNAAAISGGLGQARAMMVVGVAALVAGAIIGGDPGTIVMVGGAVIGLIGLYDYLQ